MTIPRPSIAPAHEALLARAAAIPHLSIDAVEWLDPGLNPGTEAVAMVAIRGWGPSFHARSRRIRIELTSYIRNAIAAGNAVGALDLPGTIGDHMRPVLDDQERIARCAARLGVDAPMPIPEHVTLADLRHIGVPTHALDVLVHRLGPRGAVEAVADLLQMALASTATHLGGQNLHVEGKVSVSLGWSAPHMSPTLPLDDAGRASLMGSVVRVHDLVLPDTVTDGIAGRRLESVIATGIPALDAAIVREAVGDHLGATNLYLEVVGNPTVERYPPLDEGLAAILATT